MMDKGYEVKVESSDRAASFRYMNTQNEEIIKTECEVLIFQDWKLNINTRKLESPQREFFSLKNKEYLLLTAFLNHPKNVLTRSQLLNLTHSDYDITDRSIDIIVSRLRKIIEKNSRKPQILKTIKGSGYSLDSSVKKIKLILS